MKCACSGRKRNIKIRRLCPCEQHQPPVSKTRAGPKAGTKSRGCQCCSCDSKEKKSTRVQETLGPAGGLCQMDAEGTYCQAGLKDSSGSVKANTNCVCENGKRGKKNKNIICQCPPSEPKSEIKTEPDEELDLAYLYQSYQWVDEKQVLRQKSDMTQTQSGFKIIKKKKPPAPPEPEFSVEDAVRYYVAINPDLIKDFCPQPQQDCPCASKSGKKMLNTDVLCECPPGPPVYGVPPPSTGAKTSPDSAKPGELPEPVPTPPEDEPPRGFKFSIGGKGSGSKGLSGVCCFDMVQEPNISSTKYSNK